MLRTMSLCLERGLLMVSLLRVQADDQNSQLNDGTSGLSIKKLLEPKFGSLVHFMDHQTQQQLCQGLRVVLGALEAL